MSAENHGTGTPEGDDPFAYLYRQEGGAADPAAAAQQPGVPRRSYNQVRAVGERQYPSQGGRQGYGGGQQAATTAFPQQNASPSPHYAAPETMPGGRAATRQHGGGSGRGGRGGGHHNGLLIGAIAVVAAVVIGIGTAVLFTGGGGDDDAGGKPGASVTPTAGHEEHHGKQHTSDGKQQDAKPDLPKADAVSLHLAGGTSVASDIPGAQAKDGQYVAGINHPGASATWTTTIPKAGSYNLKVRYGVPGQDEHLSLNVNGKKHGTGLNMANFAHAQQGDWAHGWTTTFATVHVGKGQNTFTISCQPGDKCDVNLDQLWFEPAQ